MVVEADRRTIPVDSQASFREVPLVSVMLPVYNGATTLSVAIRSIVWQTLPNWELVLLDDGSSDASTAVAAQFADPRIRIIADGRRKGLAGRLNEAIDLARGRYLARMDQDDVAFPERLANQVAFLEENPEVDLLGTRAIAFRGDGQAIGLMPFRARHEAICAKPWNNIPIPHPTWLGRAEWFQRHRYRMPEVVRGEDQELLLRASRLSTYACLDEVLLGYRQGPFSASKVLPARRNLLGAQLRLHVRSGRIDFAMLSVLAWVAKSAIDLFAAIPGLEQVFFARMAGEIPSDVLDRWTTIWARTKG